MRFLVYLLLLWPALVSAQSDLRTRTPVGLFRDMQADTVTSDLFNHFAPTPHVFFHVTEPVPGRNLTGNTGVLVALDFDNDGITDFVQGTQALEGEEPSRLWLGGGDGTFSELADSGLPRRLNSCVAADLDNDGWVDLVLRTDLNEMARQAWTSLRVNSNNKSVSAVLVLRNEGGRRLVDVTRTWLGEQPIQDSQLVVSDLDQDGWLDLVCAREIARARCEIVIRYGAAGGFDSRRERIHSLTWPRNEFLPAGRNVPLLSVFDLDGDGDQDLLLLQAMHWLEWTGRTAVMRNHAGKLADPVNLLLPGISRVQLVWADVNNDGRFDAFAGTTDYMGGRNELFLNRGQGRFTEHGRDMGLWMGYNYCTGVSWADWDNDGWLDLCQNRNFNEAGYTQPALYLNQGGARFVNITAHADSALGPGVIASLALDADRDGDLDLLLGHDYIYAGSVPLESTGVKLLRNDSRGGHWLEVELEGVRSNRSALGGRAVVHAAGRTYHQGVANGIIMGAMQPPLAMHFGLGGAAEVDSITVRWPDGRWEKWGEMQADRRVRLTEGEGESRSGR